MNTSCRLLSFSSDLTYGFQPMTEVFHIINNEWNYSSSVSIFYHYISECILWRLVSSQNGIMIPHAIDSFFFVLIFFSRNTCFICKCYCRSFVSRILKRRLGARLCFHTRLKKCHISYFPKSTIGLTSREATPT